jgi:hypothetical protein
VLQKNRCYMKLGVKAALKKTFLLSCGKTCSRWSQWSGKCAERRNLGNVCKLTERGEGCV